MEPRPFGRTRIFFRMTYLLRAAILLLLKVFAKEIAWLFPRGATEEPAPQGRGVSSRVCFSPLPILESGKAFS